MHHYTRVVFALNACCHVVMGLLCLFAPALAIGVYGGNEVDQASTMLMVAFRLLGVHFVPIGVVSAIVACRPEANSPLRQLVGLVSMWTLVCWGVALSAHDLTIGQMAAVSVDAVIQSLIIVSVVGYTPSPRAPEVLIRRRAA
jgi:hypothetical protein